MKIKRDLSHLARGYLLKYGNIPDELVDLLNISRFCGSVITDAEVQSHIYEYLKIKDASPIKLGDYLYNRHTAGVYQVLGIGNTIKVETYHHRLPRVIGRRFNTNEYYKNNFAVIPKDLPEVIYKIIFRNKNIPPIFKSKPVVVDDSLFGLDETVKEYCPALLAKYKTLPTKVKISIRDVLPLDVDADMLGSLIHNAVDSGCVFSSTRELSGYTVKATDNGRYIYTSLLSDAHKKKLGYRKVVKTSTFINVILGFGTYPHNRKVTKQFVLSGTDLAVGDVITFVDEKTWRYDNKNSVLWPDCLDNLLYISNNTEVFSHKQLEPTIEEGKPNSCVTIPNTRGIKEPVPSTDSTPISVVNSPSTHKPQEEVPRTFKAKRAYMRRKNGSI